MLKQLLKKNQSPSIYLETKLSVLYPSLFAFVFCHFFTIESLSAQANNYGFKYSTTPKYQRISGGTNLITGFYGSGQILAVNGPTQTATVSGPGFSIGFDFVYAGQTFTHFAVNQNGYIVLGNANAPLNAFSSQSYALKALHMQLTPNEVYASTSLLKYGLRGNAGSRILTVEWHDFIGGEASTASNFYNFQIELHEGTNEVRFIYDPQMTLNNTNPTYIKVGITGATPLTDYHYRTGGEWSKTARASVVTGSMLIGTSYRPANVLQPATVYTFSKCLPISMTPSSLTLPEATVGTAFSVQLTGVGGVEPFRFEPVGGNGFSLNNKGVVSGTPTSKYEPTPYALKARMIDAHDCEITQNYTMLVKGKPSVLNFTTAPTIHRFGMPNSYNLALPSNGNPNTVVFTSSDPTVAVIKGNNLQLAKTGVVDITATQAGTTVYADAVPQTVRLTVLKGDQVITFAPLTARAMGSTPFNLQASASSFRAVVFTSSNTNVATVSGSTVTLRGVGTTQITASVPGTDLFNEATPVVQTLTVTSTTSTAESAYAPFVKVSPTIGEGTYTLQILPELNDNKLHAEVINLAGQKLLSFPVSTGVNIFNLPESVSKGLYFVSIRGKEGHITFKIVKQ